MKQQQPRAFQPFQLHHYEQLSNTVTWQQAIQAKKPFTFIVWMTSDIHESLDDQKTLPQKATIHSLEIHDFWLQVWNLQTSSLNPHFQVQAVTFR